MTNHRAYIGIGCGLAIPALAWQFIKLLYFVEETGFYTPSYATLVTVVDVVLLALLVLWIGVGRFGLNNPPAECPPAGLLQGFAAALMALLCLPQLIVDWNAATTSAGHFFALIPNALLAVAFAGIAAAHFAKKTISFGLTVLPVISEFIRLVAAYAHYNGIARIGENVIYVLFLCSFLGFSLAHCRLYSGIRPKKAIRWVFGLGISTLVLGLSISVPYLVLGGNQHPLSPVALGAAVYAGVFVLSYLRATPPLHLKKKATV